jgi:hypothetical protein
MFDKSFFTAQFDGTPSDEPPLPRNIRWTALLSQTQSFGEGDAMSAAVVRALKASLENPEALAALAQVEKYIAEAPNVRPQTELNDLIDKWDKRSSESTPVSSKI